MIESTPSNRNDSILRTGVTEERLAGGLPAAYLRPASPGISLPPSSGINPAGRARTAEQTTVSAPGPAAAALQSSGRNHPRPVLITVTPTEWVTQTAGSHSHSHRKFMVISRQKL